MAGAGHGLGSGKHGHRGGRAGDLGEPLVHRAGQRHDMQGSKILRQRLAEASAAILVQGGEEGVVGKAHEAAAELVSAHPVRPPAHWLEDGNRPSVNRDGDGLAGVDPLEEPATPPLVVTETSEYRSFW